MSLFTRARRHVDMNRVKELREERIKEETIAEVRRQQENILAELKRIEIKESPKYSNWRRDLNEAITMSTAEMGMINLPPNEFDVGAEANKNARSLAPKNVSSSKLPLFTSLISILFILPSKVAEIEPSSKSFL